MKHLAYLTTGLLIIIAVVGSLSLIPRDNVEILFLTTWCSMFVAIALGASYFLGRLLFLNWRKR